MILLDYIIQESPQAWQNLGGHATGGAKCSAENRPSFISRDPDEFYNPQNRIFHHVKITSKQVFSEYLGQTPIIELRNTEFLHEPYWSEWSGYGPCTEECGVGQKVKERVCIVNEGKVVKLNIFI